MNKQELQKVNIVNKFICMLIDNESLFYALKPVNQIFIRQHGKALNMVLANVIEKYNSLTQITDIHLFQLQVLDTLYDPCPSIFKSVVENKDVLIDLTLEDLLWLDAQSIEFILNLIANIVKEPALAPKWLENLEINEVHVGDIYFSADIPTMGLVGIDFTKEMFEETPFFYIVDKKEGSSFCTVMFVLGKDFREKPPQWSMNLNCTLLGRKFTPGVAQRLAKKGLKIDKSWFEKHLSVKE